MIHIPIFLSADNNYAPFVATTIASICDHTSAFCEFYILDGGITAENKEKICDLKNKFNNFSIEFMDVATLIDENFKNAVTNEQYGSKSMYSRLLIPTLKPDFKKVIYSDVDVIFKCDIAIYYEQSLDGYAIACVQAPFVNLDNFRFKFSPEHVYFCSGNIIVDCEKWRKENILGNIKSAYEKYADKLKSCDQDLLNIVFDNNYKVLDQKYCVTEFHLEYNKNVMDIAIRHYGTTIKPWEVNPTVSDKIYPNLSDFWDYARKTPYYDELFENVKNQNIDAMIAKIRLKKILRMKK